jgi:flagellar basal-body rod protein FlgB
MSNFDLTMAALEKSLGLRAMKHQLHASNIANSNVPDFKARRVDFDHQLRDALEQGQGVPTQVEQQKRVETALSEVQARVFEDPFAVPRGDGNTVNAEREQVEMAKNTLNKKFAMQRYAIMEGR